MKKLILKTFRFAVNLLYKILCIFPRKNKVLFCSRQSDTLTLDFEMLQKELRKRHPDTEIVSICNRFQDAGSGVFSFGIALLKSIYHLATSKVCFLDGYWPTVCILKDKKELKVVQIWHSVGKIKQSGYQTLNTQYGRNSTAAEILCMHKNYDYIISGGKSWNRFYCASFNVDESVLRNYGLPRLDYLIENQEACREEIFKTYPELVGKKVVLYAPTFRKNEKLKWRELAEPFVNNKKYAFVCKFHPNHKEDCNMDGVLHCEKFSSLEMLAASDCVITDYSSMALEAASLDKEIFYYIYDADEYTKKNGLNMDVREMLPSYAFADPVDLFNSIDKDNYNYDELKKFKSQYLPEEPGTSTEKIINLIEGFLC